MRSKMFRLAAVLMVCAMLLGTFGCGKDDNKGKAKDTFVLGCYVYADSFDPAGYQNASWETVRDGVGECLFRFDNDMTPQPLLCDTYQVSDDHITWIFHIRDGVKFSNGKPCDAQAVSDCLNRLYWVCENKSDTHSSTPYKYVKANSITADTSANTVTIVLDKPIADVRGPLCFPFYQIIDVEGDLHDDSHNYADDATTVIGTGPYVIASFDKTTLNAEFVRNEYYWQGEVPFKGYTRKFIEDDTTKAMALKNGDIDVTENITTDADLAELTADPNFYVSRTPGIRTGISYVNFKGILANDALRKAVMMAVDGKTICDVTVGGIYTYGAPVLPTGLGYDHSKLTVKYGFDVEGAKKLLDEAGIVDTDGDGIRELDGKNIKLDYLTYSSRRLSDLAEATAVSLKAIGIDTNINHSDSDTTWNLLMAGKYDLCSSNWQTAAVGDPSGFLMNWYGGTNGSNLYSESNSGGANYTGYDNDEFDEAYDKFVSSMDEAERDELVLKMEQILLDDAVVLVHGYYNSCMISNVKTVTGAEISTIDFYWITNKIAPVK
ncbi:MAG: ABC transporter substrate-binding protein [Eubacteriaceae bacterium]|nr:ABC transporter substrate-binding protein [Eubacteriaceae bacterium]